MHTGDGTALRRVQRDHRGCTRCVDAGFIPRANPVFSVHAGQRILLVGQAPGPIEHDVTRPFAGRAGRQLMRWMTRAGFDGEDDVRRRVAMTSMTTCFPGRLPQGGDRRPSAAEVRLCSGWLDSYLRLLRPRLILAVGTLSQRRFLPGRPLDELVGRAFLADGTPCDVASPDHPPVLLPLPHPSGQSRWLNDAHRVEALGRALERLAELVPWAEAV